MPLEARPPRTSGFTSHLLGCGDNHLLICYGWTLRVDIFHFPTRAATDCARTRKLLILSRALLIIMPPVAPCQYAFEYTGNILSCYIIANLLMLC